MKSEEPGITLLGKVYDPPLDYVSCPKGESCLVPTPCAVEINQNGNKVAGLLCGREAGFEF